MTAREISDALELNLATCYHLLNTLEHEELLQRDGDRRMRLGHRVGELHDALEGMLKPDALFLDELDEINRRTGETSYLGMWDGDDVVSVAVREGRGGVSVRGLHLGYRRHGYARALGRVLLAYQEGSRVDAYLERTPLESLTPHTTVDPNALREVFVQTRSRGYAIEYEEFTLGVCCVGVPILDGDGNAIAAMSVSIPRARFDEQGEQIVRMIVEQGNDASVRFAMHRHTRHPLISVGDNGE